jgi:outer membrane receptor protein involved in Fe transport
VLIAPEAARARGIEVSAEQRLANGWSWWASLTHSTARDVIAGREIARSWDQPNVLRAGFVWDSTKWNVAAALHYGTGWPTTTLGEFFDGPDPVVLLGQRNGTRLDDYRTVDVRFTRKFVLQRSSLDLFGEIANVLNRQNLCCSEYQIETDTGRRFLEQSPIDYLPRVPSVGFVWRF